MSKAKLIRRSLGGVCLAGAVVMLAVGETKPAAPAGHRSFAVYWLLCFLLVIVALLMAVLDLLTVQREARQAQRKLFEETLVQIQKEKQKRESGPLPAKRKQT